MANVNRIFGLAPVKLISGSPYTGNGMRCYKAAGTTVTNDLGVGDPVVLSGSGDAYGVPSVSKATMGDTNPIFGVIQGVKVDPDELDRNKWIDGADAGYVYVCVDKNVIYEAQADGVLTYTDINQNVNLVQTQALNRTTGCSGVEVDATVNTTYTFQCKLIGFPQRSDNTINLAYNKVLVMINNHQLFGTGTVGA